MAIKLTYNGSLRIFIEACDQANAILASDDFINMIASRTIPYEESIPSDLLPAKIAEFFRDSNLNLILKEYTTISSVGGKFMPKYPDNLWVNTNTRRHGCEYAAVLIHECVHALSFHTTEFDFTHDGDSSAQNQGTAPYSIQKATRKLFCGESIVEDNDLIEVELDLTDSPLTDIGIKKSNTDNTKIYKNLGADEQNLVNLGEPKDYYTELYSVARAIDNEHFVEVAFNENPSLFSLDKTNPSFKKYLSILKEVKRNGLKIEVIYDNDRYEIVQLNSAPTELINLTHNKDNRFLPFEREDLKGVIESRAKLQEIFDFIVKQSCSIGNPSINLCIPFNYKRDGCYARAHKMRYIFENIYGYNTEKIFSYDSKTPGNDARNFTLAVKDGHTCIYWWYHVAPIVKVAEGDQIIQYVIDPAISDHPLLQKEWVSAQESKLCSMTARVGSVDIRPSYVYFPSGATDEDYSNTDYTLRKFSN